MRANFSFGLNDTRLVFIWYLLHLRIPELNSDTFNENKLFYLVMRKSNMKPVIHYHFQGNFVHSVRFSNLNFQKCQQYSVRIQC